MARTKDLWFVTRDGERVPTARHGHGKRWLAEWTGPDRRRATRAFARKSDADRHGTAMEADRMRGAYIDPRRGTQTVREYAEQQWLPRQPHLKPGTTATYRAHLRNHVYPLLGDRSLGDVRRTDIRNFVAALAVRPATSGPRRGEPLSPATVGTVYAVLQALFIAAADDEVIGANPCTRIRLPADSSAHEKVEPLPVSAVVALLGRIEDRWKPAVALGAGAGLREGEALGLTVARADFLRRRIHVRQQAQRGRLVSLKSRASARTVPADDWVLEVLTAHLAAYGHGPGGVIMQSAHGKIAPVSTFTGAWRTAVAAAALPKGTRFHDLRHFYASALIAANLNPKVIQERLGHATISETMDTYGHLFPDAGDLGRGVTDRALAAARAEQDRSRIVP